MKRIVLILSFIFSLILVSCSKQADSLAGTKWLGAEGGSTMELTFTNTNFAMREVNLNETVSGSYVYEAPNVTFIATTMRDSQGNVQVGGGSFTGVVNGKTMTLDFPGLSTARFIKQ